MQSHIPFRFEKKLEMMAFSLWRVFAVPVWSLILMGCQHTIPVDPHLNTLPKIARLPIAVGIYYGPEFSNYEYRQVLQEASAEFVIPLGEPSRKMFDHTFSKLFQETRALDGDGAFLNSGELAATIKPKIETFDTSLFESGHYCWAEITYRFTLSTPGGQQIATWQVSGVGEAQPAGIFSGLNFFSLAIERAIQDAARKIVMDFRRTPELQPWLSEIEVVPPA